MTRGQWKTARDTLLTGRIVLGVCSLWLGVLLAPVDAWPVEPESSGRAPAEVRGPIEPSIHVPPVRQKWPARTQPIERPAQYDPQVTAHKQTLAYRLESLRLAIVDLTETYGDRYPQGAAFLQRWEQVMQACRRDKPGAEAAYRALRDEALLANPLLDFDRLLVLKRKAGQLGLPTNHQCNTALEQRGYDNELAVLSPVRPGGKLSTLFRPQEGFYVGEMDLHFDADKLLFTMPNGRTWQIHELDLGSGEVRQVSREVPDVDHFDPCYLPNGQIVFASTASFTGVPCWHGRERACCLFIMEPDGSEMRQLCYDQDLDLHPSVLENGQVIFSRWDYTGLLHAYVRPLMVMNPDGTGQRAVYGSNSYYPNCLFFPRAVPGQPNRIAAILAGYHGKNRMGELAVLDISQGWSGPDGIVHRITHRGEPIVPVAMDRLTKDARHQFLHPYPLSDKYLLAAMQTGKQPWGIYLVDVFDNIVPILTDPRFDFFEPLPLTVRPTPPDIPQRIDPAREDAVIVVHDVYQGEGLRGVPRGTIKRLRVAAYQFGYPGMAGPDKIGRAGPWEAMRILGTAPVYEDGSAKFRVPANTPITLQALDAQGKAVQLMRSWYTAMPGEVASCVGCHESPRDTPKPRFDVAALKPVADLEPWYGPPRGFDFAREVQGVLDRHCVECHDGQGTDKDGRRLIDLRDASLVEDYEGLPITWLGARRLDPWLASEHAQSFQPLKGMPRPYGNRRALYTPAYDALIPYVRRPNIEDGAGLLRPGEYHADTSELIQLLQKGHYGVELDSEDWDRLVTWIDLNAPCHGTWQDVAPVPRGADRRRAELTGSPCPVPEQELTAKPNSVGAADDQRPRRSLSARPAQPTRTRAERRAEIQEVLDQHAELIGASAEEEDPPTRTVEIAEGVDMELVRIPAGRFLMGDTTGRGDDDEGPLSAMSIERGFWMGRTEVTNRQLRTLLPEHHSGYFTKRQIEYDGPGIQLDLPEQPALRVSWTEAMEFCRRLSARLDCRVTLPTEAQWEYAARAGTTTDLWFGDCSTDFSRFANMADRSLACIYEGTAGVAVLQPLPAIMSVDDQAIATAAVASYEPNPWGLYDMHGNAAEWTRSLYSQRLRPGATMDPDQESEATGGERAVRGGSFHDRPRRCRASHRRSYPAWQGVHDVGFRVVIESE